MKKLLIASAFVCAAFALTSSVYAAPRASRVSGARSVRSARAPAVVQTARSAVRNRGRSVAVVSRPFFNSGFRGNYYGGGYNRAFISSGYGVGYGSSYGYSSFYGYAAPSYYVQPTYYYVQPTYVAPQPVYVAPPVYAAPQPVELPPPVSVGVGVGYAEMPQVSAYILQYVRTLPYAQGVRFFSTFYGSSHGNRLYSHHFGGNRGGVGGGRGGRR